ncbi:RhoGAP domain-containing protein [Cavenderia fasciculata]|uniref:RhoGAP domain-containing protein n=1 Tax=Cavenderia fasciculata TaxID=261658 RepID=F4PJE7_CACFS|nr:RhoGAP domain-containing protein [Cavenderia fasciculata]EGG24433.1 RhoGAP domain-containing protein [Cavenderia fasciculata]|eukprot:XP_004362284.1 RhoGAP domain-containing protein [Cavenderia fasciculata]
MFNFGKGKSPSTNNVNPNSNTTGGGGGGVGTTQGSSGNNKNLNNSSGNSTPTQSSTPTTPSVTSPLGPLNNNNNNNNNSSNNNLGGSNPLSPTNNSSNHLNVSTSSLLSASTSSLAAAAAATQDSSMLHINNGGINILSGTPINPNQDGGPPILNKFTRYLLAKGTSVEHIFKPLAELEPEVLIVKKNLLKDLSVGDNVEQIQISTYTNNPHVVSELLKQYLYSLPEPLFSYHLYDSFLITHTIVSQQDRLWSYRFLLAYLPLGYRGAIKSLIGLLNKIHSNHGQTKMDSQLLANIFAPVFLRPEEEMYYMKTDRITIEEIIKFWIEDFDTISKPPTTNAIPGTTSIIGGNRGTSFLATQPSFLNKELPQQQQQQQVAASNNSGSVTTSPNSTSTLAPVVSNNTNNNNNGGNKEEAHPLSPLSHPTIGLNKSSTNNNLTNATNPQQPSPKLSLPTIPKQQNTQQTTTVIKIKTPLQATSNSNSKSNPTSPTIVSPTSSTPKAAAATAATTTTASVPNSPSTKTTTTTNTPATSTTIHSTPTKDNQTKSNITSPQPKQTPQSPQSPNVLPPSPSINMSPPPPATVDPTTKKIPLTPLSQLDSETVDKINKVRGTTESLINDYIWKQLKLIAKNIEIETNYTITIKLSTILRDSKRHLIDSSQQLLSINKNDVKGYIKENQKPQTFILAILTNEQMTTNIGLYGEDSKHFELKRASHLATEELTDYIYFLKSKIHSFAYKEHIVLTAQIISKLKTILESGSPQSHVDHAARTLGMSGGINNNSSGGSGGSISQSGEFSSPIRLSTGSASGSVEDEIKTTLRIVEVCSREINERLSIIRRDLENAPLNEAIEMGKAIRSTKQTLTELYNENGYPLPVEVKVVVGASDDQLTALKKTLLPLLERTLLQVENVCKIVNTQTSQGIPPDQDCKNIIDRLLFINKVSAVDTSMSSSSRCQTCGCDLHPSTSATSSPLLSSTINKHHHHHHHSKIATTSSSSLSNTPPTTLAPTSSSSSSLSSSNNNNNTNNNNNNNINIESNTIKWRKILYEKQNYPDNFTDETFLIGLVQNVTQQITIVIIFANVFIHSLKHTLSLPFLLGMAMGILVIGYISIIMIDPTSDYRYGVGVDDNYKSIYSVSLSLIVESIKDSILYIILLFGTVYALSPVLRTLTNSFSDDTIWALTFILLLAHLFFHDYGYTNGESERFQAPISLNAAIFASVLLGSRLPSIIHVFVLISFAIEMFALFPIVRHHLKKHSIELHAGLTVILCATCSLLLLGMSTLLALIYVAIIITITFICPLWLIFIQKYKNSMHGPWDEACPAVANV